MTRSGTRSIGFYTKTPNPPSGRMCSVRQSHQMTMGAACRCLLSMENSNGFLRQVGPEFFSRTLADWGWPEYAIPTYISVMFIRNSKRSNCLDIDFPLAVQIHTRSETRNGERDGPHKPAVDSSSHAAKTATDTGDLGAGWKQRLVTYVVRACVTKGFARYCRLQVITWVAGNCASRTRAS